MKMRFLGTVSAVILICSGVRAFSPQVGVKSFLPSQTELKSLPTNEQLSLDSFMKQIAHASELVPLVSMEQDDNLASMLQAQLSHSDGIRGFFATYLTAEGETAADAAEVPPSLAMAIQNVADRKDLISLSCMNVIMPTAMSTMHTDGNLQQSATRTAQRGMTVLKYLAKIDPDGVNPVCNAILKSTTVSDEHDGPEVTYWKKFFTNYGYQEQQVHDIKSAFGSIVGSSIEKTTT